MLVGGAKSDERPLPNGQKRGQLTRLLITVPSHTQQPPVDCYINDHHQRSQDYLLVVCQRRRIEYGQNVVFDEVGRGG